MRADWGRRADARGVRLLETQAVSEVSQWLLIVLGTRPFSLDSLRQLVNFLSAPSLCPMWTASPGAVHRGSPDTCHHSSSSCIRRHSAGLPGLPAIWLRFFAWNGLLFLTSKLAL